MSHVDAPSLDQRDEHFEQLGPPKLDRAPRPIDIYRYAAAFAHLGAGSVLDVGAYFGDFMQLVRRDGREVAGTEVNEVRRDFVNERLGEDLVAIDFRNGHLRNFEDRAYDNVVCMEVLEHIPDHARALAELCRVARRRVIITVPFREKIKTFPCVHCGQFTPQSGHLHAYDLGTFAELAPAGWRIALERPLGKRRLNRLLKLVSPGLGTRGAVLRTVDAWIPGAARWLLVALDRITE